VVSMPILVKISVALFIGAEAFVLVAIGSASLPLVGAWALAALVVALVARRVRAPGLRVVLAALLVLACLAFAAEEGLFFLPAAVCLFVAAVAARHHGRAVPAGP
jgi:hypothetical protein